MFIASAVERAGMTLDDLPPYQYKMFRELRRPLDEESLAEMMAYWLFDLDKLQEGGRGGWKVPDKPRIAVWLEVTSKGNFKAEWYPRGASLHYMPAGTDFTYFVRRESRTVAYGGRPSNELFIVREFEHAWGHLDHPFDHPTAALDTPLLAACAKVVARLKERLEWHFDVRMMRDVFLEWIEEDSADPRDHWRSGPDRLVKFTLEDPAERLRRKELDELDNLQEHLGFSEQTLLELKAEIQSRPQGKTGPPPSPHTLADRLAREMKKRGHPATKGKVDRALDLIDRHRKPTATKFTDNVVSLRPPAVER